MCFWYSDNCLYFLETNSSIRDHIFTISLTIECVSEKEIQIIKPLSPIYIQNFGFIEQKYILQDIYSFDNPVLCGNTEMITEHRLLLHPPFSHYDDLVITKFRSLSGLPPLLYFRIRCPKLSFPLMSISKHRLAPKCICMYNRHLESRKQSFSLILDSCRY
jgi:hypothetical protein